MAERGSRQWLERVTEEAGDQKPSTDCNDLQQDLLAAGSEVSVSTVRCIINSEGLHAGTPRSTPPLTQKHKKRWLQFAKNYINRPKRVWDFVLWSDETKLELFRPVDQRYVWRRKNELRGCFSSSGTGNLQRVEGKMDSIIDPGRKHQALCEEAESWASLDLPTGQRSQEYLKVHQSLVSE